MFWRDNNYGDKAKKTWESIKFRRSERERMIIKPLTYGDSVETALRNEKTIKRRKSTRSLKEENY